MEFPQGYVFKELELNEFIVKKVVVGYPVTIGYQLLSPPIFVAINSKW